MLNYFIITPQKTVYGGQKYVISYIGKDVSDNLTDREKTILDTIIEKTQSMYFNRFIDYVYSTYPVSSNERYSSLNLVKLAKKYKKEQAI